MHKQSSQFGFTLIELILYISLASVLLIGVTSFFSVIKQIDLKNQAVSAVEEQGAFAADLISQRIRDASLVCTPAASASGATLDLDSNCSVHTGNEVSFSVNGGGQLTVNEAGATGVLLTDTRTYISSITFTNTTDPTSGPANVTFSFTIQAKSYGPTSEYYYSKTFTGGGTVRVN